MPMRISHTRYRLAVVLIALVTLLSATGGARAAQPMAPSVTARLSDDDPTATVRPTCVPSDDDDDDCDDDDHHHPTATAQPTATMRPTEADPTSTAAPTTTSLPTQTVPTTQPTEAETTNTVQPTEAGP